MTEVSIELSQMKQSDPWSQYYSSYLIKDVQSVHSGSKSVLLMLEDGADIVAN